MNRSLLLIVALILGGIALFSVSTWVIPPLGRKYAEFFQRAEYTNNLPRHLLAKMAEQESNYDPTAQSAKGAQGIMQIVPKWHPGVDPFNVPEAIAYAGTLMRKHFNKFGSWRKALAAYNGGPQRLQTEISEHGVNWLANMPAETQKYVARISNDVRIV